MKAVAKLREARYSDAVYMTNDQAEHAYNLGVSVYDKWFPKYIPCGFYGTCLDFGKWLEYYHIILL